MISCKNKVSGSIQLGPGTIVDVCKEHLIELNKVGEHGTALEKSVWTDKHFNYMKNQLLGLKTLRKKYPYDEHNEKLWKKVSIN